MVHTRREEEPHPSVPVRNWDVLGLVTTMAQCLVLADTTPSQCVWKRMDGGKRVSLTKAPCLDEGRTEEDEQEK